MYCGCKTNREENGLFTLLDENDNIVPFVFGTSNSACADLSLQEDVRLAPGEIAKVPLGVKLRIPETYRGILYPRSSLLIKYGITSPASVIDGDYKGIIYVSLCNMNKDKCVILNKGEYVCQIEVMPAMLKDRCMCCEFIKNERGTGGFGSTNEEDK